MPISIKSDTLARLITVVMTGEITTADLITGDDRFREDANFHRDCDQLIDTRDAHGVDIDSDAIRTLANRAPLFSNQSRRAIVAKGDLGFGIARMYELNRAGEAGEIQVFRDLKEAKEWLAREGRNQSPVKTG